jgi:hypothetical protein
VYAGNQAGKLLYAQVLNAYFITFNYYRRHAGQRIVGSQCHHLVKKGVLAKNGTAYNPLCKCLIIMSYDDFQRYCQVFSGKRSWPVGSQVPRVATVARLAQRGCSSQSVDISLADNDRSVNLVKHNALMGLQQVADNAPGPR